MKKRIASFLDNQYIEGGLFALIVLCIVGLILESDANIYQHIGKYLQILEIICVSIFSIEYVLRIVSANSVKILFRPLMVVDLLAILPFYLKFLTADLIFLRVFRLFRVFRVFKVARYSKASGILSNILIKKKEELVIISLYLAIAVIVASCLMYAAEGQIQECFSSIPKTMWWAIVTFTTVGYGDTFPVTPFGKVIAAVVATFGIALYSLLTGVLGSAFMEEYDKSKEQVNSSPSSLQDNNQELSVR